MSGKKRHSTNPEDDSEPIAKRTRLATRQTVLNYLNEDCWHLVLDYVDLRDIVRSERVSKRWQGVVNRYLRGVRLYARASRWYLRLLRNFKKYMDYGTSVFPRTHVKCRILNVFGKPACMEQVIQKYGPAIVVADCLDEATFRALVAHSSNLQELHVFDFERYNLGNLTIQFNKLRWLSFEKTSVVDSYPPPSSWSLPTRLAESLYRLYTTLVHTVDRSSNDTTCNDDHIRRMLGSPSLESLTIYHNNLMTGTCLSDLNSNIKTLQLDYCKALDINLVNLLTAHHLLHLTKLELRGNSISVMQNVYMVLRKTPNLTHLSLDLYENTEVGDLVDAICALNRLKSLSFNDNENVRNSWLEAIGLHCPLESLGFGRCERVTISGIESFCRGASTTLTALHVGYNDLSDDDIVRCVTLCPNLEELELIWIDTISPELPAILSPLLHGRRQPLSLIIYGFGWNDVSVVPCPDTETYPNIILQVYGGPFICYFIDRMKE